MMRTAFIAALAIAGLGLPARAATPLSDIAELSVGFGHSCARTTAGAAWCWGWGEMGQLGDGTASSYPAPVPVEGLSTGVVSIAAGGYHTCALTSAGGVKCWGRNAEGEVGDGTTTTRLSPVDVVGLASGVSAIWVGSNHSCAIVAATGAVRCWGANAVGQLGDGTTTNRSQPTAVLGAGGSGVTAGTGGATHTCVIANSGAYCWGANNLGQLGDGSQVQRTSPVAVAGMASGVATITAGSTFTCATSSSGAAKCWGANIYGKLGIGVTGDHASAYPTPQAVTGLSSGVVSVDAGDSYACALLAGGTAKCWGINAGQMATGTPQFTVHNTPADASLMDGPIASIGASMGGNTHTCVLGTDARVRCVGDNFRGQLGRGSMTSFTSDSVIPQLVLSISLPPMEDVASLSSGPLHTCALGTDGSVRCWGSNFLGRLGDGTTVDRPAPVDVAGIASGAIAVAAGTVHTCAAMATGGVKCWGRNDVGQLGDGTTVDKLTPVDVSGVSGATRVAVREGTSCAIVAGGALKCWGRTIGTVTDLAGPFVDVALGKMHGCLVTQAGGVKCWGDNGTGALGDGTTTERDQPVDVVGLASGVASIHAGDYFTCALLADGTVRCWGMDNEGQLGRGGMSTPPGFPWKTLPEPVVGMSGVVAMATGLDMSCAVLGNGDVKCWGRLSFPQTSTGTPTQANYLVAPASGVAIGSSHQCMTTPAGRVRCWGSGNNGQLGRGYFLIMQEYSRWVTLGGPVSQTITFAPLPDRDINDTSPITLSASASSGLPVGFSSATTLICTVSGTTVTILRSGTCTLVASQSGNFEFFAAQGTRSFQVTGTLPIPGRLANISSRALVQTGDNVAIAGFIIQGGTKRVVVRARGPSLAAQGVSGVLANPSLQVVRLGGGPGAIVGSNDDWQQPVPNAAAIQATGFAPSDPTEAAVLLTLSPGGYTAVVSGVGGTSGVAIIEVFELDTEEVPLVNISTRAQVLTGDDVLIGGFVIQGSFPMKVVVRARGPSLVAQGVAGAMSNPTMQLFSGATLIGTNDEWGTAGNAAELQASGYQPLDPQESAIMMTLNPGAYTAVVSGVGSTTGVGIVEVFAVP